MFFVVWISDIFGAGNGANTYSEGSIDSTLGSDGVTSGRKEFGNTGSLETSLCKAKGSTETRPTSPSEKIG
jgi:hypothetical protein